jgi:hypothetical protein
LLHDENENLTHRDLNTSVDEPENRWNIHHVSYDTLTSRAKPSSNGRLSHYAGSLGFAMNLIGPRQKAAYAGELRQM